MSTWFGGLWRHPDFMKLWVGQSTSMFGSLIGGLAYDLAAILTLHAAPAQIAVLNGCALAPGIVLGPWAGIWADRGRRRPLLIAADCGRAVALFSIPVAAVAGMLTMLHLYIVAALVSGLTVTFDVSYRAYLPSLIGADHLVEGNSKLQATEAVAEAGGFGISGVLVQLFSAPWVLAIDAASFLVSAASLMAIHRAEPAPYPERARSSWADARLGIDTVWRDAVLRTLALTMFVWEGTGNVIGVVIMLYFVHDLHLAPAEMGIFGVGGVSAFVGALVAGRVARRWGLGRTLIGGMLFNNIGLLATLVAAGPMPVVLLILAIGQATDAGRAIYTIHSLSMIQSRTPQHMAGRVNATFEMLRSTAMVLGLLVGGALGATAGLRGTLWLALIASLLTPLLLVFSPIRQMRWMAPMPEMMLAAPRSSRLG